eukprot:CAMPEP_0204196010 /NCGR_PEP_ID=MMETSP0361-20130328/63519_1 /ASSEMBLY_ACC=CAM_ASM_000343 /TAXON_ID=268821 /ORGANISM="Scrippsiella Hangoei, Strain SHTV-5" /LENGTH=91 /DNA_ID=CAMNT_0051157695 /DNA_START=67 /DNA_END=339 /DNA_ORIENTATION=+
MPERQSTAARSAERSGLVTAPGDVKEESQLDGHLNEEQQGVHQQPVPERPIAEPPLRPRPEQQPTARQGGQQARDRAEDHQRFDEGYTIFR